MGLAADEAHHVFKRFYRAKGIRQLEGTGRALYICQGIATAHGGRIWAESAGPGQGSAFCFTLPSRGQGIATARGGRIWAESAGPGQGSAFCFTLPRRGQMRPNAQSQAMFDDRAIGALVPA
jgi:signal transduction histidine kinase